MVSDVNLVWQKRTNTKQKSTFRMLYIPAACTSECYDLALPDLSLRLERQEHLFQFQDATELLPCHTALPVHLRIRDPRSRAAKKNTSHGNEVLSRDTTHLIPRPCYQRGSPCQDPAGSWTVWTPDHRKEKHTEAVSRSSGLAKTILQGTVKGGRRQHQGMDRPGARQVPEGSGEQGKMEKTGCKIICGAPTTPTVKAEVKKKKKSGGEDLLRGFLTF